MSNHSDRPLSPHLQVYRPQITSVMSITHRATGVGLAASSLLLVAWLLSAAYCGESYGMVLGFIQSTIGQIMLILWSFAFYYHLGNGIRHLFWDIGKGYALDNVTRSGVAVILFALLATAGTWACIHMRGLYVFA